VCLSVCLLVEYMVVHLACIHIQIQIQNAFKHSIGNLGKRKKEMSHSLPSAHSSSSSPPPPLLLSLPLALGRPITAPQPKPAPASPSLSLALAGRWDPAVRPVFYLGPATQIPRCRSSGLALPPPPRPGEVKPSGMFARSFLGPIPSLRLSPLLSHRSSLDTRRRTHPPYRHRRAARMGKPALWQTDLKALGTCARSG
jgi:hypothetical protein